MHNLLNGLKALIADELLSKTSRPTELKPLETCEVRPDGWIAYNYNSIKYPACFIWSLGGDEIEGRETDSSQENLRVMVKLLFRSTKADISWGNDKFSPFAIYEKVYDLLRKDKQVNQTVDGLKLPITFKDFDVRPNKQSFQFYGVGREFRLEYIREYREFAGWRNNDTEIRPGFQ